MDGSKPENGWSNRWNQTADLVVPSGKNMFVLNTNSWTDGYWDSYSDADKSRIYLKVNENWKRRMQGLPSTHFSVTKPHGILSRRSARIFTE